MGTYHTGQIRVLSVLTPADVKMIGGLPGEAIMGILGSNGRDGFRPNAKFAEFMNHVIRVYGPEDPSLREAAEEQGEGCIAVIDHRTPEGIMGNVPPEDIIGVFLVTGGRLGEYVASEHHRLFTKNGMVQLPLPLQELHLRELRRLRVEPADVEDGIIGPPATVPGQLGGGVLDQLRAICHKALQVFGLLRRRE